MTQAIADFIIHVDETLPGAEMASLADNLAANVCVRGACVSENARHIIMVSYDSDCTHAHDLIEQIRARGVHAEGVGW